MIVTNIGKDIEISNSYWQDKHVVLLEQDKKGTRENVVVFWEEGNFHT